MMGYLLMIVGIMLGIWAVVTLLGLVILFIGYLRSKWEDKKCP